jgi:hypothetical protein
MIYRVDRPSYSISEMQADVSAGAYSSGFQFSGASATYSVSCSNLAWFELQVL